MKKFILISILFFTLYNTSNATLTTPGIVSPFNGATNQNPNVQIDWSSVTGATNYEFKLGTNPTLSGVPAQSSGSNSYYNTSELLFGTTYYWQVRAKSATDSSNWSAIWHFTTLNNVSLASPTNSATGRMPNVTLDWDLVSGITYYDYEYDTTVTFNSLLHQYGSVASGTSEFTTSNLLFGTKYYWRVRARHSADTSQWSAIWNFTTLDNVTLVTPTNGATGKMPNVTLDWDLISGITYYDYEYDTTVTFNSPLHQYGSVASGTSEFTTSNLRFGTKYYWRVRARHAADTSQWSAIWNFTTLDNVTLVTPTNGATGKMPNVTLDWDYVSGITYYDYEYDTTVTFNSPLHHYGSVANSTSQVTTSNLLFGTKYYWRARARHAADTTQWSSTWNFTTLDYLTHVSPTNGATNVSINPTIDWNGITGITEYRYRFSRYANFETYTELSSSTTSQATLSNLFYGETYYWQVRAGHSADTSEWSQPWHFTTAFQLTVAPNLISPTNNSTDIPLSSVTLEWSSVTGATFYEIKYDVNSSFTNPVTGQTPNLTYNSDVLQNATTYYWKVRAGNSAGFSPWSAVWNFTTEVLALDAPILVSPPNHATNIPITGTLLEWLAVSGATMYDYMFDDDPLFNSAVCGSTPDLFTATCNLEPNTTYYWKVIARNETINSPWSEVWTFTTGNGTFINDFQNKNIFIYPNPVNSFLTISITDDICTLINISLIDLNGKIIWMQNDVYQKIIYLDVKSFSNGQYFLKIENFNKKIIIPIIIEH